MVVHSLVLGQRRLDEAEVLRFQPYAETLTPPSVGWVRAALAIAL
jgi:hypothetical protein